MVPSRSASPGARLDEPAEFVDLVEIETDETVATRLKDRLRVLQAMTVAIARAPDLRAALCAVLRIACKETGWVVGQAWMPAPRQDRLRCVAWFSGVESLEPFHRASARAHFELGVGLPGRVWTHRKPAWIRDAANELSYPRGPAARRTGILGAFAVPVVDDGRVVAVLEFFSLEPREEDRGLLSFVAWIAIQIGAPLDRARIEDARRHEARAMRTVADTVIDAVISLDEEGKVRSWNHAAEVMFGVAAETMIGSRLERVIPSRYRERHRRGLERLRLGAEARILGRPIEMHALRGDGSEFPIELTLGQHIDVESQQMTFAGVVRDISERRRTDLMAEGFLETLSQDLRDPLASILGFTDLLERHDDNMTAEERADCIRRIGANVHRVEEVFQALLDLERLRSDVLVIDVQKTDIAALIRRAVREAHAQGPDLTLDLAPVVAVVDARKVERLVQTLVANRMGNGTTLRIALRRTEDGFTITVEDDGPTIPDDVKAQIFEPAELERPSRLGLALVGQYARLHGGRAWIEDREGGGASFHVHLREL